MKEKWKKLKYKDICKDKYEISNYGNIRLTKNKNILKISQGKNGYMVVNLKLNNGKWKVFYMHILVLKTFSIFRPISKNTVNHIDGKKYNNHIENLEWADHTEQRLHAYRIGLRKTNFDKETVKLVCDMMEKGFNMSQIRSSLDNFSKKEVKYLVENIIHKSNWKSISKEYKIENYKTNHANNIKYDKDIVKTVCSLYENGIFDKKEISEIVGVKLDKSFKDFLRNVYNRKNWTIISKDYNW